MSADVCDVSARSVLCEQLRRVPVETGIVAVLCACRDKLFWADNVDPS